MVLLLAGLLMGGCRSVTATQAVKIGLIAPFEGTHRELGYAVLAAVQMAIRERNAAGGLAGRPVELVALNDEMDPRMSALQVEKLALDPGVIGIIGPWSPAAVRAVLPAVEQYGLPLLVPVPYAGALPVGARSAAPTPADLAGAAAVFLEQRPAVVVLAVDDRELQQSFQAELQARGWPAVDEVTARGLAADGEMLMLAGMEDMPAVESLLEERYSPVLVLYGPYAPLLRRLIPAERWPAVYVWDCPRQGEPAQRFAAQYRAQAGQEPLAPAFLAYDAAQTLLDAVGISRSDVARALGEPRTAGWCVGGAVEWVPLDELP